MPFGKLERVRPLDRACCGCSTYVRITGATGSTGRQPVAADCQPTDVHSGAARTLAEAPRRGVGASVRWPQLPEAFRNSASLWNTPQRRCPLSANWERWRCEPIESPLRMNRPFPPQAVNALRVARPSLGFLIARGRSHAVPEARAMNSGLSPSVLPLRGRPSQSGFGLASRGAGRYATGVIISGFSQLCRLRLQIAAKRCW